MKSLLTLTVLFTFMASLFAKEAREYRESDQRRIGDDWVKVVRHIQIRKFRMTDRKWRDIISYIERESKLGDKEGKGVTIYVPDEFQAAFARIADETWTLHLADGLDLWTVMIECPPPGWTYFPVEPRRIALIPRDQVIRDVKYQE